MPSWRSSWGLVSTCIHGETSTWLPGFVPPRLTDESKICSLCHGSRSMRADGCVTECTAKAIQHRIARFKELAKKSENGTVPPTGKMANGRSRKGDGTGTVGEEADLKKGKTRNLKRKRYDAAIDNGSGDRGVAAKSDAERAEQV